MIPVPPSRPDPGRSVLFAVLGGVASGKSTVATLLAGPEGRVLSGDAEAHKVLALPETRDWLLKKYGPQVLGSDGLPDRAFLAGRVFEHAEELKALEDWIHPRVRARIIADLTEARALGVSRIVLDIPLLMESEVLADLRDQVDHLVFVDVPQAERERRAGIQRGWAPGEVARREAAQMSLEKKRNAAHIVLASGTSLEQLALNVQNILTDLGL